MLFRSRAPDSQLGGGWPHRILESGARQSRHLPEGLRLRVLGAVLGPKAAWWLRERLDGTVAVRAGTVIRGFEPWGDGLRLDLVDLAGDRSALDVDHVIAATGYRYDVDAIAALDPNLRSRVARVGGFPRLDGALGSSVPGLHFTGLAAAATLGPSTRFVFGSAIATPMLARALVDRAGACVRRSDRTTAVRGPVPQAARTR